MKPETTVLSGFWRSAAVSITSVGVPPTESVIRPPPTHNSEMHGLERKLERKLADSSI
jgi:hypothetical protein